MTLVLKDFKLLKEHFNDTVKILLARAAKEKSVDPATIEGLSPERQVQIQFLQSLLDDLDKRNNQSHNKNSQNSSNIFYGAMHLIQEDIKQKRRALEQPGLLHDRLNDCMGITDSHKPTSQQLMNYYQSLNQYLSVIYANNKPQSGLAHPNLFSSISLDNLRQLLIKSYALEQAASHRHIDQLTTNGATPATMWLQSVTQINSQDQEYLLNKFASFDRIIDQFDTLVIKELADKSTRSIESLDPARSSQLQFLKAIKEHLNHPLLGKDPRTQAYKIAVFAGAMHIVRTQIEAEYSNWLLSSPKDSCVYQNLNEILGPIEDAHPEEIRLLVNNANILIQQLTLEQCSPAPTEAKKTTGKQRDEEVTIKTSHLFSKIAGFSLQNVLKLIQDIIKSCRESALTQCVDAVKKSQEASTSSEPSCSTSRSYVPRFRFWGASKGTPEVPSDPQPDVELSPAVLSSLPSSSNA